MKCLAILLLLILVVCPLSASVILFYSGDFDPNNGNANGLANETDGIVGGIPYGAATYQNFVFNGGDVCATARCQSWWRKIGGLFTNNLSQLTPTSGYWEIRSGMSEGNGGLLIASGTGPMTQTPTGRGGFGYTEYTDMVQGLSVALPTGTYWFAVVPNCTNCFGRSFNSNTFGLNRIGTETDNQQYWNSAFFGANFTNANNDGVFPAFSGGVMSTCSEGQACDLSQSTEVPEPSSLLLLGTAVMGAAGVVRRHLSM